MKEKVLVQTSRKIKVLHQLLCISEIDFEAKSLVGFTELTIVPLSKSLKTISLNCSQQVQLERIVVDGVQAEFRHSCPLDKPLENPQEEAAGPSGSPKNRRDLKYFSEKHLDAAKQICVEEGGGELKISLPEDGLSSVQNMKSIKIGIDFSVDDPHVGLQFVGGKSGQPGRHLFTFRSVVGGSCSRTWFPCLDSWNELSLWKLEVLCDTAMTVVCSGELRETVYTLDMNSKTHHYVLNTPTAAGNIGMAVGDFQVLVHPEMNEITSFAPPGLLPMLKYTMGSLEKIFEFFEELLASRFPFGGYKQVFVDQASEELVSYSGLSIFSVNIMFHRKVVDPVPLARSFLANGVAQQFFGCFVTPSGWLDYWITSGIARYVTGLYMKKSFGNNEYLYHLHRTMVQVCDYEASWGPIVLRPRAEENFRGAHALHTYAHTASPLYVDILSKKAHLAVRMLEKKLGKELLYQVLNKLIQLGMQGAEASRQPASWSYLSLSTESFFRTVSNLTGQELPTFLDQWIFGGGHAHFVVNYEFNRKRNMVELEIKQEPGVNKGRMKYVGPVTVTVQELDGAFSHTVQIDGVLSRENIGCHSKARRQRKKKIPLWTGEEIDIDLSLSDPDSPVLWVKIDPDLALLRKVDLKQPDYHWQYQLKHDKDILAQFSSLEVFPRYPTAQTRHTLLEVIENENIYYRIRTRATMVLAEVANKLHSWTGPPAMLNIFRRHFGAQSDPTIPRPNNFNNFQAYFLQQAIPSAMAVLRSSNSSAAMASGQAGTHLEIHKFIMGLIRHNDNSSNRFSDDHYRSGLLRALAQSVVHASPAPRHSADSPLAFDSLPKEVRATIEELTLALSLDKLRPSHCRTVTVGALNALSLLQKKGLLPPDPEFWRSFLTPGIYSKIRYAAAEALLDLANSQRKKEILYEVIDLVVKDPDPGLRYHIARILGTKPVFFHRHGGGESLNPLNSPETVEKMWSALGEAAGDARARGGLIDAYSLMYGRSRPSCLLPADSSGSSRKRPLSGESNLSFLSMPPLLESPEKSLPEVSMGISPAKKSGGELLIQEGGSSNLSGSMPGALRHSSPIPPPSQNVESSNVIVSLSDEDL